MQECDSPDAWNTILFWMNTNSVSESDHLMWPMIVRRTGSASFTVVITCVHLTLIMNSKRFRSSVHKCPVSGSLLTFSGKFKFL